VNPRNILQIEGAAVLALSLYAYHWQHGGWGMFALLFLVPDVSMLGYLANPRAGATAYNSAHTYIGPLLLGIYSIAAHVPTALLLALIWIAHIGFDRLLGYGLKYPARFKDTHLDPNRHRILE